MMHAFLITIFKIIRVPNHSQVNIAVAYVNRIAHCMHAIASPTVNGFFLKGRTSRSSLFEEMGGFRRQRFSLFISSFALPIDVFRVPGLYLVYPLM